MRTVAPQMSMTLVPLPGTTEALELGCTCQFIAHESVIHERQPAGMLTDPDPNCPLHKQKAGTAAPRYWCREFSRAGAGRLPKLTTVMARRVASREPARMTAGGSDRVRSRMNGP
jgi:hypothetical protein